MIAFRERILPREGGSEFDERLSGHSRLDDAGRKGMQVAILYGKSHF